MHPVLTITRGVVVVAVAAIVLVTPGAAEAEQGPCQYATECLTDDGMAIQVHTKPGHTPGVPQIVGRPNTPPPARDENRPPISDQDGPSTSGDTVQPGTSGWAPTLPATGAQITPRARPADTPCATGEGQTPKLSCVNYTTAPPAPTTTTPASGTATAPAAPAAPTYTAEQAATQAWTTQTFTKATVAIQPTGNTTLTGLPTYFHATYGPDGLAPGETTTVTVLGHTITLRPTDVTYTYHYGDTATHGPTTDAGGPYPTGTVTHTYPTKGTVTTRIDTTLSGQYQENNGPWRTIPGATTITGQPQRLTIATLQSRLHH